jgi:hypothetical protein
MGEIAHMKLLIAFLLNNFPGGRLHVAYSTRRAATSTSYGCNGAGKTSTEDAFLWLLFGKDSADRKDYDLIPHKPGETVPDTGCGREPVVEATARIFRQNRHG